MTFRFNSFTPRKPKITFFGNFILVVLIERLVSENSKDFVLSRLILKKFLLKLQKLQNGNPSKGPFLRYFLMMWGKIEKCEGLLNEMNKLGVTPEGSLLGKMRFGFQKYRKNPLVSSQRLLPTIDNSERRRRNRADSDASIVVREKSNFAEKYKSHDINQYINKLEAQISKKLKMYNKMYMELITSPAYFLSVLLKKEEKKELKWNCFVYYLSRKQAKTIKYKNQFNKSNILHIIENKSKTKNYGAPANEMILRKLRKLKDLFGNKLILHNFKEELTSQVMCFLTNLQVFVEEKFSDGLIEQLASVDLSFFGTDPKVKKIFDCFTQKVDKLSREKGALERSLTQTRNQKKALNTAMASLEESFKNVSRNNSYLTIKMKKIIEFTEMEERMSK